MPNAGSALHALRHLFIGRRRPFSSIGIRRKKCMRCGNPARYQWGACANGNRWAPLCAPCDVLLNAVALAFMLHPHARELLDAYAADVQAANPGVDVHADPLEPVIAARMDAARLAGAGA